MIDAVNDSEQFVYDICRKSFLSLWSYINPQGKTPGKELCDVLVVCDPHILIISVKDIQIKNTDDPSVDWKRWQRKAIEDSIKQIKGAVRWLDQLDYVIQKDGSQGLKLPSLDKRIYHRVAVAFGGQREVPISSSNDRDDKFYHVLDEQSFLLLLRHLDTISDFVNYLIDKESLLSKTSIVINGGEENLLAIYLHNNRQFPSETDMIILNDDLWDGVSNKPEFKAKLQKDTESSYLWDRLIELMCHNGFDENNCLSPDVSQSELAIRVLVREDRFSRRILGRAFKDFLESSRTGHVSSRCVQSITSVGYVFFAYNSDSTLEDRRNELLDRCFASLCHFSECSTVIGIGVNVPGETPKDTSSDLVMLHTQNNKWSEEDLEHAKYCRDELGFFKSPNQMYIREDEYPTAEKG